MLAGNANFTPPRWKPKLTKEALHRWVKRAFLVAFVTMLVPYVGEGLLIWQFLSASERYAIMMAGKDPSACDLALFGLLASRQAVEVHQPSLKYRSAQAKEIRGSKKEEDDRKES